MRKIIILIAFVVFVFLITTRLADGHNEAKAIKAEEQKALELKQKIDSMSVVEIIDYVAPQFGQDPALIKKITWCESNHRLDADHDGGYGLGVSGFHRRTFNEWKVKLGRPELIYESNFDQITLMSLAFSKGEEYRRAWTTYRAYTNGGVYTFWSNLLQGWYTVVCR